MKRTSIQNYMMRNPIVKNPIIKNPTVKNFINDVVNNPIVNNPIVNNIMYPIFQLNKYSSFIINNFNLDTALNFKNNNNFLSCSIFNNIVDLYTHDDNSGNQKWLIEKNTDNTYFIRSQSTNKYLGSNDNNTVILFDNINEKTVWKIVKIKENIFRLSIVNNPIELENIELENIELENIELENIKLGNINIGSEQKDLFAFIIPSHPKDYHYIYNFISQLNNLNIHLDIFIVFSNNKDYNNFNKKYKIIPIILPRVAYDKNFNYPTYKKFYALNFLKFSKYEFFIVPDSEIKIIENNFTLENIVNKYNNFYNNKKIYGGITPQNNTTDIMKFSTSVFQNDLIYKKIQNITLDFKIYTWWSDIPFYKRDYLPEFFALINFENINLAIFKFEIFENITYQMFLIYFKEFTLINLSNVIIMKWSLENFCGKKINNIKYLQSQNYGFGWCITEFYKLNYEVVNKEKTFLLYHLDRKIENNIQDE